jgi:DNA-binding NtrC family response regulator
MFPARILIVDDDPLVARSLGELLHVEGHEVAVAGSVEGAHELLASSAFHLVLSDVKMPGADGFDLLGFISEAAPRTPVVLITGYGSVEQAVRAIKAGAYDYLTKPLRDEQVMRVVQRALDEHRRLVRAAGDGDGEGDGSDRFGLLIGQDGKMLQVFELIRRIADSQVTVLLTGESGTGKNLVARELHHRSPRRDEPFLQVSCGALPDTLLESELFGHVRGSFTGALCDTQGKFEAADGGTVFLDEVSTASAAMQVKLLRVLESKQFQKVGDTRNVGVDVRLILATNNNLEEEVDKGRFRQDLYYRIKVVTVDLPPLRDRAGDIPLLAEQFLRSYNTEHRRQVVDFTTGAMSRMKRYPWPGNVRELENAVERAVILSRQRYVTVEDLPPPVASCGEPSAGGDGLKASLAAPERELIERALSLHRGRRKDAAQSLGISRTTLYHKMKRYGLLGRARSRRGRAA